ncbi:MAG TPA: hypothetical protein VHL31_19415 [Geminicoccus sp.]|jgi:hypothetical protein|uniref:hypothetical protein n=1 Tax=Geminicoccus sp. TaxID=2024832 RepID=UPI002E30DC4A|nr:hypothetical protein [Geminicoccus sp.]HEX2528455.1 hypothetical protein [Geminicoccus sp.]
MDMNSSGRVVEIVTPGTPEALNEVLASRGITPDRVINVRFEPARPMALGDWQAKYRVLVRAS